VHLSDFPVADKSMIDKQLEERMEYAQEISSMVLSLRKKTNLRVRQPLQKILIPVSGEEFQLQMEKVSNLISSEVNVKEIEYLSESAGFMVKKIKANFKTLGPKYGKYMKDIAATLAGFTQDQINQIEKDSRYLLQIQGEEVEILISDVDIITEDIPGWVVANQGTLTVALDITLTPQLIEEGIARELVNRIQNLRKDKGFDVTDKISLKIEKIDSIESAIAHNYTYICSETLCESLEMIMPGNENGQEIIELTDDISIRIVINRIS
jgi:isoleucyl-tRNA synthetase